MYQVVFTKQAIKDRRQIARSGLELRAKALLGVLTNNPYQTPPPYERLIGDLSGASTAITDWYTR